MRLIDADALKKDWNMANRCEDCPRDARDCQYGMVLTRMDVCGMLDDAPTVGGWISVQDRLPDIDQRVLVSLVNNLDGHRVKQVFMGYTVDPAGKTWFIVSWKDWALDCDFSVTHWMPLPNGPEEVNVG